MSKAKILIMTEGGRNIGFGHVMRCAALSQAFQKRGILPELIINGDETVGDLLKDVRYKIFNWLEKESELSGHIDEAGIVIIDSYLAGPDLYENISGAVKVPVYIDDNRRLDFPKGVVVNGSIFADRLGYPEGDGVDYLLGAEYAILRDIFWDVPDKKIKDDISSVMVMFGGDDKREMTAKVLKALDENYPRLVKNVIIGKGYSNVGQIEKTAGKNTNLIFHPDPRKIKDLMHESDVAITAAGQSLYELARMGLAAIAVAVADNQLNNARGWCEAGFIEYAGWWEDRDLLANIIKAVAILRGKETRRTRSEIGMRNVSGDGVFKVVDFLSGKTRGIKRGIVLRKASTHDCEDLRLWRNHPEVRKYCFDPKSVAKKDHDKWFLSKIKDAGSKIYIAHMGKDKVGVIRFDIKKDRISASVNLNPEFFNRRLGNEIIRLGTEKMLNEMKETKPVVAEIKKDNIISQKAFLKAGYKYESQTGDRAIYVKELVRARSV